MKKITKFKKVYPGLCYLLYREGILDFISNY